MDDSYEVPSEARAAIVESMTVCTQKWDSAVVPVGGTESLLAYLMACDVFGPDNTLAVTAHSVFSDSRKLAEMEGLFQLLPGHHCTIDITRPIQETLQLHIGLHKVEVEQLHFSMDQWQKAETIVLLRNAACRSIAVRSEAAHIEAYSASKIEAGWVIPSTFDWNPMHMLSRKQALMLLMTSLPGGVNIEERSGLDAWPDGGPFPADADIDLNDPEPNANLTHLSGNGIGAFQGASDHGKD